MRFLAALAPITLAAALATGCGGTDGPSAPAPESVRFVAIGPYPRVVMPSTVSLRPRVAVYDSIGDPLPLPPRNAFEWSSSDPAVVTVSKDGEVRVSASAAQGEHSTIHVVYGEGQSFLDVYAALPPIGAKVVPERTITPGGQLLIYARVVNPQGLDEQGHVAEFSVTGGASNVRLSRTGCGSNVVDCVATAPDIALLQADAPGEVTVQAVVDGQVGTGTITVRTVSFTSVTAGGGHTCGTTLDGALFCWGATILTTPMQIVVPGLSHVQAYATQTCGLDTNGLGYCWFPNADPQPEPISTTIRFTQLASGPESSCGLDFDGQAWCWGANGWGQLGDGTKNSSLTPVVVAGGYTFGEIATYGDHACALTTGGDAYCWGSNYNGELGDPTVTGGCDPYACSTTPVLAAAGHTFAQIVTGRYFSCGRTSQGPAWCWGAGRRLGAGDPPAPPGAPGPVQVSGGQSFTTLTAGADHVCGLTPAGAALCWGDNFDGQTGQTPSEFTALPTAVPGGHSFSAIDAGAAHTCGVATDGLYCWGDNGGNQLGLPIPPFNSAPVRVTGQP